MKKASALILIYLSIISATTVLAEIHQCNGILTNKPCEGESQNKMEEKVSPPRSPEDISMEKRKLLIHDLDMKRIGARNQFGLEIGITSERSICMSKETTEEECAAAVSAKEKEIEERSLIVAQSMDNKPVDNRNVGGDTVIIQQNQEQNILLGNKPRPRHTPSKQLTPEEEAYLRQLMLRGEIDEGASGLPPSGPAGN